MKVHFHIPKLQSTYLLLLPVNILHRLYHTSKKLTRISLFPYVRIMSLEWICSIAYGMIVSLIDSISSAIVSKFSIILFLSLVVNARAAVGFLVTFLSRLLLLGFFPEEEIPSSSSNSSSILSRESSNPTFLSYLFWVMNFSESILTISA